MKKYLLLLIIFTLITPVHLIMAQLRTEDQVSVIFSPKFPKTNERVSVHVESYQFDLEKSNVSWFVDGKLKEEGVGLKDFNFYTGGFGTKTDLIIKIIKPNGGLWEKKYTINPGELDLYSEALTYTPPFYRGRPDFSRESSVRLVAIANFTDSKDQIIPNEIISYNWKIDGEADQRNSGLGKNTYYYSSSFLPKAIDIVVDASVVNSNQTSRVVKTIEPIYQEILVYEKNPVYGIIFDQTIKDDFVLDREEVEVVAIPYGFDLNVFDSDFFKWKLNGKTIDNISESSVVFRNENKKASKNIITVETENPNKMTQLAEKSFGLNFSNLENNYDF